MFFEIPGWGKVGWRANALKFSRDGWYSCGKFSWVVNMKHVQANQSLNPLHLNISMYILHTVLCTFPKVLTWRIRYRIRYRIRNILLGAWYCKEKWDAGHSLRSKVESAFPGYAILFCFFLILGFHLGSGQFLRRSPWRPVLTPLHTNTADGEERKMGKTWRRG